LRVSYVYPIDKSDGGAATRFLVRIQEPKTIRDVRAVVDRLDAHRKLADVPTIAAIEVAFDARPKPKHVGDRAALDSMTLRLMRGLLPPSRELARNPRQWDGPALGTTSLLSSHRPRLDPTKTLYAGTPLVADHRRTDYVHDRLIASYEAENGTSARSDDERALDHAQWRVYRKVADEQFDKGGERRPVKSLPPQQHRARAEVTLTGQMLCRLNLQTLDDLAALDFALIARKKLLRFVRVAARPFFPDEFRQRVFIDHLGIDERSQAHDIAALWHRDSRGRESELGPFLIADADLNRRLSEQLARLSQRFGESR